MNTELSTLRAAIAQASLARGVIDPQDHSDHAETIDHPDRHTRGINDFVAAEMKDMHTPTESLERRDVEPHGMYWFSPHPNAAPVLRAHAWFYKQVATTAADVLAHCTIEYGRDTELKEHIKIMAGALREYIQSRNAINQMAAPRKLKNELDDAMYQLCQSAKYFIDAAERAQYSIARGESLDDNARIGRLKSMSEEAAREGYAVAQAVIMASDAPVEFNFELAAKRVVDYSCRRLTEWFAAKRQNEANSDRVRNMGAAFELTQFFKRIVK